VAPRAPNTHRNNGKTKSSGEAAGVRDGSKRGRPEQDRLAPGPAPRGADVRAERSARRRRGRAAVVRVHAMFASAIVNSRSRSTSSLSKSVSRSFATSCALRRYSAETSAKSTVARRDELLEGPRVRVDRAAERVGVDVNAVIGENLCQF
jgi:hypothetical protein